MSDHDDGYISSESAFGVAFWACMVFFVAWLGLVAWIASQQGDGRFAPQAIGIAILTCVLGPPAWFVANKLRLIAMPDVFFTRGFVDSLETKLFWAIGPQVLALLLLAAGSTYATYQLGVKAGVFVTTKGHVNQPTQPSPT